MTTSDIEGWVLDYACRHNLHEVVAALYKRYGDEITSLGVCDSRLAAATIHRIVFCREILDLPLAVELTTLIYKCLGNGMSFRSYCQLVYGLKMKIVIDSLQRPSESNVDLVIMLSQLFPKVLPEDPNSSKKDLASLKTKVRTFRKFVLSLLCNEQLRNSYFHSEYDTDFGDTFWKRFEKYVIKFLEEMNEYLPLTVIDKILTMDVNTITAELPVSSISMDVFLECMIDKSQLTSNDLLDLFTVINPIGPRDRIRLPNFTFGSDDTDSYANGTESKTTQPSSIENRSTHDQSTTSPSNQVERAIVQSSDPCESPANSIIYPNLLKYQKSGVKLCIIKLKHNHLVKATFNGIGMDIFS